jgi:hypothetical protein
MINLLPPTAKKKLTRDNFLRLVSMIFIIIGIAGLVFLSLSLPTLVMLKNQLGSILDNKDFVSKIEEEQKLLESEAAEIEAIVAHVKGQEKSIIHTEVMDLIDSLAGEGVVVDRFVFGEKDKLTISGTASTRPGLSDFRDRLAKEKIFSSVELPLASLVDEKDAVFNITMVVK